MRYADLLTSLICMNPQTPPKPDVPAEIRAEMARRGWSVKDLAERTGLSHVTLYRRFGGDGRLTIPELTAIAAAFGMAASTLVARAEDVAA